MQLKIDIRFVSKGKFPHPDNSVSLHSYGFVYDKETGEKLGIGILSRTDQDRLSFSVNKKDFDYAFREGSTVEYLCFVNLFSGNEYAITKKKAWELVVLKPVFPGVNGKSSFYVIDESSLTGEDPEIPF